MTEIASFEKILWAITMLVTAGLATLVLWRRNHKVLPVFFAYIFATLAQNLVIVVIYRVWGFRSHVSFEVGWATQGVVIVVRTLAVAEIFRRVLANYRGVWAMVWRILLAAAGFVLVSSWIVARHSWQLFVLNTDRGFELAIAVMIVLLFLFAHYYGVKAEPAVRVMTIGFFLYSCFHVLNDTILETLMYRYSTFWNLLGTLAFLATLLVWNWALRKKLPESAFEPELLAGGIYYSLTPEINQRLKGLNERLSQFWYAGAKRP